MHMQCAVGEGMHNRAGSNRGKIRVADDRVAWKGKPRHGDGMPGCKDEHLGSNSRLSHPHVSKCAAHFLMSSSSVFDLTSGAVMRVFLGTSLLHTMTCT